MVRKHAIRTIVAMADNKTCLVVPRLVRLLKLD
jgi:hypothetical protein